MKKFLLTLALLVSILIVNAQVYVGTDMVDITKKSDIVYIEMTILMQESLEGYYSASIEYGQQLPVIKPGDVTIMEQITTATAIMNQDSTLMMFGSEPGVLNYLWKHGFVYKDTNRRIGANGEVVVYYLLQNYKSLNKQSNQQSILRKRKGLPRPRASYSLQ